MSFSMFEALSKAVGRPTDQLKANMNYPTSQSQVYSQALPNLFPVPSSQTQSALLQNSKYFPAVRTTDPNSGSSKPNSWLKNTGFPVPLQVSQNLIDQQNTCAGSSLESLRTSYNPSATSRCGWIYKKGTSASTPVANTGALGTRNGPVGFVTQPKGTWYWDLEKAQKQIDADTCGFVSRCEDINTVTGCAWSKQTSSAIPINPNGTVKYPGDLALSAPQASLVREVSSCPPAPPPSDSSISGGGGGDVCSPLSDGRLSRDCMLQRVTAAGCAQGGALYTALSASTNPNNYAQALESVPSYITYQRLSTTPLMDSVVKSGRTSTSVALDNFKALYTASQDTSNRLLNSVARDLCTKKGEFDSYDFCADYTNSTSGPFDLSCLQRAWRQKGGLPAGTLYPTVTNKASYDAMGTWGAVNSYIQSLADKTRSSDVEVQKLALKQFMGIVREVVKVKQIGKIYGSELYYFNRSKNEFMGRRIKTSAKGGSSTAYLADQRNGNNPIDDAIVQNTMWEFYYISNIRPTGGDKKINIAVKTDDGAYVSLNKTIQASPRRGQYVSNENELGVNWDQAPTQYTNPNCWTLTQNGPNYVTGTFNQTYGNQVFNLSYKECGVNGVFTQFPESWVTLTQEVDAPMLSFEFQNVAGDSIWQEFRLPALFPCGPSGGAYKKDIGEISGYALGNSGSLTVNRLINMQSWRTITLAFKILSGTDVGTKTLFSFGPNLAIKMRNANQLFVSYGGQDKGNIPGSLRGASGNGDKTYLVVINQRSDYYNQLPDRLTVTCASIDDWKSGSVSVGSTTNSYTFTRTPVGTPLFPATDSGMMVIGSQSGNQSAPVWIQWLHVFDQELTSDTVQRDAKSAWIRAFM